MMLTLAQAIPTNSWNDLPYSGGLYLKIAVALVFGFLGVFAISKTPTNMRKPLVVTVTFLAGLYYVIYWLWPTPIDRDPQELPLNFKEAVSFWFSDSNSVINNYAQVIAGFLGGLGLYSLLKVHFTRLTKRQKDWFFSAVLIVGFVAMTYVGFKDYHVRSSLPAGANELIKGQNWTFWNYANDLLFDGLMQQMTSTMFSLVAFYILSAAYRAFRIKSVEASILMATALIVMLSLLGAVEYAWSAGVDKIIPNHAIAQNLHLNTIYQWIQKSIQNPGIRAIDFGLGIGGLAMGIRLWLSLDKGVVGS